VNKKFYFKINGETMKKLMILILSLLITTVSFSQTELTLEEAIKIALQRNSALVKAKYNIESSEASLKSAWGDLLPNFGVRTGWNWGRVEDPGGTQLDALGNPYTIPPTEIDTRNYNVGAGGSIVLFNGLANISSINAAEDDLDAANLNIDKFKRDIVQTTKIYYYTILKNKALLKVKEENFKYNNKLLETITERNKLGSAPVADLYAQQVQTGSAEVQLIQAVNSVDAAQNTLINYLALDVLKEYKFTSKIDTVNSANIEDYNKEFDSIAKMVEFALASRTDYLGQQKIVSSANEGITIAKGTYWPSLTGGYNFSTTSVTVDNLFDRRVWGLNLNLNIPIFSNFNTETSVQFAKVRELSAKEDLRALERQIQIEVKQGYLDFQAVSKALDVSIKTVRSASENRRVQYERYSLGSGTFLDVLQSDRDYQNAISLRIDAEFNFHSAREALLNSIGKLEYKEYENSSKN
jgi:outer membrane protein